MSFDNPKNDPQMAPKPAGAGSTAARDRQTGMRYADQLTEEFLFRLNQLNARLYELSDIIQKENSRVWGRDREGTVILMFYDCGPNCMGCPHPAWYKAILQTNTKVGSPGYGNKFINQVRIKDPGRMGKVKRAMSIRNAVAEANELIDKRTRLIGYAGVLRQHLSNSYRKENKKMCQVDAHA